MQTLHRQTRKDFERKTGFSNICAGNCKRYTYRSKMMHFKNRLNNMELLGFVRVLLISGRKFSI